ncbi:MAG TPA: T9SS type A sorting domain-containing protein [Crocinitomicaceae bacterium]|nr:T9SS type A sorting domain-containing protein [Crocinitomicaceae bacterium]
MRALIFLFSLFTFSLFSQTDTITVMSYNLLNFPDGRNDCGSSNTNVPNRFDTLRKILGYSQPDIFVACEVQNQKGADSILTRSLNVFGANNYAAANFHPNNSGLSLQNILYYNSNKLTLQYQDRIITSVRDIDHYVLYSNDPNLGNFFDTTFFEVYMCHLKAGSSSSNQSIRNDQVTLLRSFIDARPAGRNHFVCGDLNVYRSTESCYQNLISGGLFPLKDPINSPGTWNNNGSFSNIHTQSTRTSGQAYDCGSTGGLDDRFDQILVSANVLSGADSLKYLSGSYASVGNDGNHFNSNLLSGSNSQYPDSVVNALYYMSDHLPVILKTVVTYPTSNGLALNPSQINASCYSNSDGSATVQVNAGQGPYSFLWDDAAGQTTQTATNLAGGTYCVTVTDALGEIDNVCIVVGAPSAITIGSFPTAETNNCNGSISVLPTGGQGSYTYSWDDPLNQNTQTATNLCAGPYTVTVTDEAGCQASLLITVIDNTVGLAGIQLSDIKFYPNPIENELIIEFPLSSKAATLNVYSLLGEEVRLKEDEIHYSQESIYVNTVRLHSGIYLIVIRIDETILRFKVIKN